MSRRLKSWLSKGFTATARLQTEPAIDKDIDEEVINRKLERGGFLQNARLRRYPSIEVNFSNLYAGTFRGSLQELTQKMFEMGYRNQPTAYVEVTDKFGPDDGSFAKHTIEEDTDFPHLNIGRPFGNVPIWNRVKLQDHVAVFVEGDEIHLLAHREPSAWLQPARHLAVDPNEDIGIREFRLDWQDEFDESLPTPLS